MRRRRPGESVDKLEKREAQRAARARSHGEQRLILARLLTGQVHDEEGRDVSNARVVYHLMGR